MIKSVFHTATLPPAARFEAWNGALADFAVRPERGDAPVDGIFDGRIDSFTSADGLAFSLVESSAQRIRPNDDRTEDVWWLTMVLDGDARISVDGAAPLAVAPGDMLFGRRGAAGVLELDSAFRLLMVNLPGQWLARQTLLPLPGHVVRVAGSRGIGHVLGAMLGAVATTVDQLDDARANAIGSALPQLLTSSVFGENGEPAFAGATRQRALLLRQVWHGIESRLGDSELCIASVAEAHRLTVRYLQRLFEDSGRSFSEHVRQRRLERCRASLADPVNADVSITTICLHWGFNDSATFSRAFRAAFDMTPRDYRQQALCTRAEQALQPPRLGALAFNAADPAPVRRRRSGLPS
ncbi:hypothetical protein BH09PSE6_BH09PSE6_14340 [soil metagenome]